MSFKNSAKEIIKIAIGSLILSVVLVCIFALFGHFSIKVVWGGLLGVFTAVLNFTLLALTLEFSLGKGQRRAQGLIGLSYTVRLAIIAVIVVFAIKSPHINYIAAVIPLVFPRIIITALNVFYKNKKEDSEIERTANTL